MSSRAGRVALNLPVVVDPAGDRIPGETQNIGLGGLFVATSRHATIGERVSLELGLPRWTQPVVVEAEVRWVRVGGDVGDVAVPGMGVSFTHLPLYLAATILELIRSPAP